MKGERRRGRECVRERVVTDIKRRKERDGLG